MQNGGIRKVIENLLI